MYEIETTILGVLGSPTRNGGTKYDVQLADGNSYSTFDGTLAGRAQSLIQQPVRARVSQKPKRDGNGFFLNLEDVAASGQPMQPMQVPNAPATQIPAGTPVGQPSNIPMAPPPESQEVKTKRITFLSAVASASQLVGSVYAGAGPEALDEAIDNTKALAQIIFNAALQSQGAPRAMPVTPEAVAAAVPGVEVGAQEAPEMQGSDLPNW